MQKPTISVPEMAAELGIGLTKAYQLVHEPNFPTIRIGTRILIPVDRFHEWLTQESKAGIAVPIPEWTGTSKPQSFSWLHQGR